MGGADYFSVPIFFIIFRECLEASIIVSVLLAFIKKSTSQDLPSDNASIEKNVFLRKRLVRQVWFGAGIGLLICLIIGGSFIGAFYALQKNIWGSSEELWEGCFSLVATTLITIMGLAMLRINKLKSKWTDKLSAAYEKKSTVDGGPSTGPWKKFKDWTRKYSMFVLPFVTVLREGLEAVVFVGGVGLSTPAKAFPIPVILGLLSGFLVGLFIYKGNRYMSIEYFLIASTWILYLVGAGLFSKGVGYFEAYRWNKMTGGDAAENGSGAGSYNIHWTIWHVNFGNPEIKTSGYGWQIFNAILGWNNTGTYATVLSYIFYWVAITVALIVMRLKETHPDHRLFQFVDRKKSRNSSIEKSSISTNQEYLTEDGKDVKTITVHPRELSSSDSQSK